MDSSTSKAKKYTLPVKLCDMEIFDGMLIKSKSKTVTPKPIKHTMPVRLCDMDLGFLEHKSTKKSNVKKQLWQTQPENKNSTKIPKNNAAVSVTKKKGYSHDENMPLINLENYENNPNLLKKRINQQKPKPVNSKRLSVPKTKKINGPQEKHISTVKETSPTPKTRAEPFIDEEKLINIFDKKIHEITNRIELKYNEILRRLDKLELDKKTTCEMCSKKCITSTSASTYEENNLNSSCFMVENDKMIKSLPVDTTEMLATANTPEVNDMINNVLSTIEGNLKPKQLFQDSSNSLKNIEVKLPVIELNKFELLEARLEKENPDTFDISLSDTDSPLVNKEDMLWILNDNKDTKCLSTPVLVPPKENAVRFVSKSYHDIQADSYGMYNEIRDKVKFLCTPKNTTTLSNLMTPSVENSQKKIISRRVQKQLLMLE